MIANIENAKLNASMLDPQSQAADLRSKGKLVRGESELLS
jgi:hypothetical protein